MSIAYLWPDVAHANIQEHHRIPYRLGRAGTGTTTQLTISERHH
jgi:hypothetical protein